jgi:thiamine-phosphate pyrophosphorylase
MLRPDQIVGLSVGSPAEWQASREMLGAVDYIGTGPVYATATKADAGGAIGVDGLREMIRLSHLPVVAIGGIGLANAAEVMAAAPQGLAVVSAIMAASDPNGAARTLRQTVDQALGASA